MSAMGTFIAVCTNKRSTGAGPSGKRSNRWWGRDVYHLRHSGITTLCGRDLTEWLTIGPIETLDSNCCMRCVDVARTRSFSTTCIPTPKFLSAYPDSFAA
jgi:hypothetical protein